MSQGLTPGDFHTAITKMGEERIQPTQLVMHPMDGIAFSVMQEDDSYVELRKPVRERIRSCARWVRHWKRERRELTETEIWFGAGDDPFTLRDMFGWFRRELRTKTWKRLTPEAQAKIERLQAEHRERYA